MDFAAAKEQINGDVDHDTFYAGIPHSVPISKTDDFIAALSEPRLLARGGGLPIWEPRSECVRDALQVLKSLFDKLRIFLNILENSLGL